MFKSLIYIVIFFSLIGCKAQNTNGEKLNLLIKSINNESVIMHIGWITTFELDQNANKIITIKDNEKIKLLKENLLLKNKALICHILLTKIIEPEKSELSYKYNYDSNGKIESIVYSFNGISWVTNDDYRENILINYDKQLLKNYWSGK